MRIRLGDERGMTLIELLVGMVVSLILIGATMSAATALSRNAKLTEDHNEAQDVARTFMDRLARQLRNRTRWTPPARTTSCSAWSTRRGPAAA